MFRNFYFSPSRARIFSHSLMFVRACMCVCVSTCVFNYNKAKAFKIHVKQPENYPEIVACGFHSLVSVAMTCAKILFYQHLFMFS